MQPKFQWLIPILSAPAPGWKRTQTPAGREEQLTRAQKQRQRRAERNLKLLKARAG